MKKIECIPLPYSVLCKDAEIVDANVFGLRFEQSVDIKSLTRVFAQMFSCEGKGFKNQTLIVNLPRKPKTFGFQADHVSPQLLNLRETFAKCNGRVLKATALQTQ